MKPKIVRSNPARQDRPRNSIRFAALTAGLALLSFALASGAVVYERPLMQAASKTVAALGGEWRARQDAPAMADIDPVRTATLPKPRFRDDPAPGVQSPELQPPGAQRPQAKRAFARCGKGKRVTCVVDGDTFWLDGRKIRIADIDTPEISKPRCRAEAERGERAAMRLVALLNQNPLRIMRAGERDTDVYGRDLRLIMVDGRSVGSVLIAEGLARPYGGGRRPWC